MFDDLGDEQRAHLAHGIPADLDSSTSSPSSSVPPLYDPRRRPKSASRHRSHTTADGSSSSHLLACLVSREEEVRELNAALLAATEHLEGESSRANAAERRALDYFHRLRIATENRERSDQESARLREELKLYKAQLESAQKEIFRAQDIIDQVAAQRNEAEAEAARARTKARKLQEEKLVMMAREEGHRVGYREGLSMGRRIGYEENYDDGHDDDPRELLEDVTDDERNDPRSHVQLRSSASLRQPPRSESAPPVRMYETAPPLPVPSRVGPVPSHEHRSPPDEPDEPETIHPIPIRVSPVSAVQHIVVPPDGWVPRAESRAEYIPVPPPRIPSPISVVAEFEDALPVRQPEPTPVPPPVRTRDYAYQAVAPPPVPHMHTPSLASRTSTHISQYDIVNKRPASSLRNEIYVGRAGSGSQPSRASSSRSEHREPDRRTEAEGIIDQWRADSDTATPPRNPPPRSHTPVSRRPSMQFYRPREIVTPTPLGDVGDSRPYSPALAAPAASHLHAPPVLPDDPALHPDPPRARSPLEYLRQRFRQRPSSGGSGSIPNIIVESPSEPETTVSPSATIAAQPELLSPEAANRPLSQDDSSTRPSQSQSRPRHHYAHPTSSSGYDRAASASSAPWPAGFVPYPSAPTPTSRGHVRDRERDRDRDKDRDGERDRRDSGRTHTRTPSYPPPPSYPYSRSQSQHPPSQTRAQARSGGYPRTRTQSTSSITPGRATPSSRRDSASVSVAVGGPPRGYEAAPLPPGVVYPAPPPRPHTSHGRRGGELGAERVSGRERESREWAREPTRDKDRDRDRPDLQHLYEHERDKDGDGDFKGEEDGDMLTRSPAPLGRPISLFDSDED